ncbi:hypothetical protein GL267_008675 [Acidithiobacillus ferrianus]|uniref:Uncharacterized protein n=2 Tax=Acidithiobacillus ferrianus TaxID=2678518 RepID=A0A845U7S0_9PROT|nr:hypothetical protein [Acidithiobacillus ferrianus]NDU43486.1 hypothetical protein [Acidithiobacillus ferrianus]
MKKITIHEITLSVSFDSDNYQEAAEMAASLVRDCEWAAYKINESHNPRERPAPVVADSYDWLNGCDDTVHHDDPF